MATTTTTTTTTTTITITNFEELYQDVAFKHTSKSQGNNVLGSKISLTAASVKDDV